MSMKGMFSIGAACIFMGMAVFSQSGNPDRGAQDQFVGAWHLAWLEQPGADGKLHRIDCCGMLVDTRDGHMSVQVMERNPPSQPVAEGSHPASLAE